ncbi:Erg28-like protein [Elsinoe fawcettii]|nr:Erg28-like protein [Elsinoe fawcettii]
MSFADSFIDFWRNAINLYIPEPEGLLPKWIMLVGTISIVNSLQAYQSLAPTQKVYAGPQPSTSGVPANTLKSTSPVTPLSARTFGTWTFITGIVRIYAAHLINQKAWYEIAMYTFAVAWGHFVSEWLVFKTVRLNAGSAGPLCVATGSLVWMWAQKDFYVK